MSIFQKHSKFSTYATTLIFSLTIIEYYDANDVKINTTIYSCYVKTTEEYKMRLSI